MNNDTSNIIILSPNYHRIIHKTKAEFDKEQLAFIFPKGLIDNVRLNKHLFKWKILSDLIKSSEEDINII